MKKLSLKLAYGLCVITVCTKIIDVAAYYAIVKGRTVEQDELGLAMRRNTPGQDKNISLDKFIRDLYISDEDGIHGKGTVRVGNEGEVLCGREPVRKDIDILFMGGSTTENVSVPEENRFHCIIEKAVGQSAGRIVNAGHFGNHTMHTNVLLLGTWARREPRRVVMMHGINDINTFARGFSYYDDKVRSIYTKDENYYGPLETASKAIKDTLFSNIYILVKGMVGWRIEPIAKRASKEYEDWEKEYMYGLRMFIGIARAGSSEPILMTQPSAFTSKDKSFRDWWMKRGYDNLMSRSSTDSFERIGRWHREMNDIVRKIGRSENVKVIDLERQVGNNRELYLDAIHLNSRGNRIMAEVIIKELGLKVEK